MMPKSWSQIFKLQSYYSFKGSFPNFSSNITSLSELIPDAVGEKMEVNSLKFVLLEGNVATIPKEGYGWFSRIKNQLPNRKICAT